jgi:hypothetical protein
VYGSRVVPSVPDPEAKFDTITDEQDRLSMMVSEVGQTALASERNRI